MTKVARGNTRRIIMKVGEIQQLVGVARGAAWDDRNPDRMERLISALDRAHELCIDITGMYAPVDVDTMKEGKP